MYVLRQHGFGEPHAVARAVEHAPGRVSIGDSHGQQYKAAPALAHAAGRDLASSEVYVMATHFLQVSGPNSGQRGGGQLQIDCHAVTPLRPNALAGFVKGKALFIIIFP